MKTLTNKIQNNFNKASTSYDNVANIQRMAANSLIEKVLNFKNFSPKHILDLGTGTGYVSHKLMHFHPSSTYYLNDISPKMLEICRKKFFNRPNIIYLNTEMTVVDASNFDLIISNLALQWVNDLWKSLEFFKNKNADIFAFSTLLDGTFQEWEALINKYQPFKIQKYPPATELIHFCDSIKSNYTFEYWLMDIPMTFENPLLFMQYLKLLGASSSDHKIQIKNIKALFKKQKNNFTVSYKIFFGLFKKAS